MEATLGSNPSFIQKSILWGREIIFKCYIWRIGGGVQVIVYKDNWIPRPITSKPISFPTFPSEAIVSELIDNDNQ